MYLADCTTAEEDAEKVKDDWKFVAMVMDRMFLWIFTLAVFGAATRSRIPVTGPFAVGTAGIVLQAPSLYDGRPAIDELISEIEAATATKPKDHPDHPATS
jgi:hypothetical protein